MGLLFFMEKRFSKMENFKHYHFNLKEVNIWLYKYNFFGFME